tara:strand:- start:8937 stop:9293 length:357 start_codon:yes stop_codon:yes gene_type:complete
MIAPNYDITINQGSDWQLDLTVKNDSGSGATGADLTQTTFECKMRPRHDLSPATSIVVEKLNSLTGKIRLSQGANTTRGLVPGNQVYDLEMTLGDPLYPQKTLRILEGTISVKPEATR